MKFQKLLFATIALMGMVGCADNGEEPSDQPQEEVVYTISVDKDTIESDGVDEATFIIKDQTGADLTADKDMLSKIYFVNMDDDSRLPRNTRTFQSMRDGTYTFYATIRGVRTSNEVTITSQNRSLYEKFKQKVCIFQCTATWCGYCPQMTEVLTTVSKGEYGDNVILLGCHADGSVYARPYKNQSLGTWLCYKYNGSGYPYAVYDLAMGALDRSQSYIEGVVKNILLSQPATCGIKISKVQIDDEGNGVVEASVKASKAGTFDLAWAVLVDNQPQNGGNESVYNNVVIAFSDNFTAMSDSSKVSLEADEEHTQTFEFKITPFDRAEFKASDCKVVVFAHNGKMIDNANICAVGKTANYIYN